MRPKGRVVWVTETQGEAVVVSNKSWAKEWRGVIQSETKRKLLKNQPIPNVLYNQRGTTRAMALRLVEVTHSFNRHLPRTR